MDAKIAEIRSNDAQLAGLNERYRGEIADLKAKISAAANQPEIARIRADQLKVTEDAFARSQQYEARAAKALERAVEVRNAFLRDKQRQVTAAKDELGGARRKEWEPRVAQILARR